MAPPMNPYAKKPQAASNETNPYKRAATSSLAPSGGNSQTDGVTRISNHSLPTLPVQIQAATFSQAFADEGPVSPSQNEGDAMLIAANNSLRQSATASAPIDLQEVEDRDHHVLLQPHVLYVSTKQRGNDVLKYIRNVPMAVSKMVPDYIMSTTTCALFLSIKYHQLYPLYIHRRIGELRTDFRLRILLVLVDVEDNANALAYLNKLAVTHNLTLILAWTEAEAARYLETYKALDGKDASSIQKRESTNFHEQIADFLTACKPVNKTDAGNLLNHFSTMQAVAAASSDELALCEGLGPVKVRKLYEALHKPFSKFRARQRKRDREEKEHHQQMEEEAKQMLNDDEHGIDESLSEPQAQLE
jgi:DNA excision repair protein ERCC-1